MSWEAYLNFFAGRYRVFLGHKQYFVSSDVGAGKMQWYAFHKEPPGGVDEPNGMHSLCVWDLKTVRSTPFANVKFSMWSTYRHTFLIVCVGFYITDAVF